MQYLSNIALVLAVHIAVVSCVTLRGADGRDTSRGLLLGTQREEMSLRTGFELELSTLSVKTGAETTNFFQFSNASVNGHEVACINCNTQLFLKWVRESRGLKDAGCKQEARRDDGSKHPNSPGYKKWAKENKVASLLDATPCNFSQMNQSDIQTSVIKDWDLDAMRPRLQTLWSTRRLVVGYGMNPLRQQMDFGDVLLSLARNSPLVTPLDCEKGDVPHCNAIFSGLRKTASIDRLNSTLVDTFSQKFLDEHRYRKEWNATEQRQHVQAVLTEMKSKYFFYYQKCLAHESDSTECNTQADSAFLGQVACQDGDDELSDDCVYAELRYCTDCGNTSTFFEYSRFHGPLALFETKSNRKSVMGQCEEFSRAGHALLSMLGYETRYVLDFTDHVWVEVRIPKGTGTWLHADPSEGVLDSPLMYEKGWGKQLTMIFAFTPWKVEHITATYTDDYSATVSRRGIPDNRLKEVLDVVNQRLNYELPLRNWGHAHIPNSKDKTLREVALWAHFEAN